MKTYRRGLSKQQKRARRERCSYTSSIGVECGGYVAVLGPVQFRWLHRAGCMVRTGNTFPRWRWVML